MSFYQILDQIELGYAVAAVLLDLQCVTRINLFLYSFTL